ncbi:MAG TPA: hypothetical protein VFR86_13735 [Burkholderiaceae bacterium]|nr:hypothetical protein [Burkholderiaceae bacterium]
MAGQHSSPALGTSYLDTYGEHGHVLLWGVQSDGVKTGCRAALGLGE